MSGRLNDALCAELVGFRTSRLTVLRARITEQYMATITLRVPDELDRELERLSSEAGASKSDLAREALRRYLLVPL
jgi:Ribbon-helix-helix protein, copG family